MPTSPPSPTTTSSTTSATPVVTPGPTPAATPEVTPEATPSPTPSPTPIPTLPPDWDADGDLKVNLIYGGDDCNDSDGSIYPGAPEIAGDGVDQDCDGYDPPPPSLYVWPAYGWISQYYSGAHPALDIGAPWGAPVYAARGGMVTSAGWMGSCGYGIWIAHDISSTLYCHLSAVYVSWGQWVSQGSLIGAVGSTGLSTGPHLHFAVQQNGYRINPLEVLP